MKDLGARFLGIKNPALLFSALSVLAACTGCNNQFPESSFYQNTNPKTLLLNGHAANDSIFSAWGSSEEVISEFAKKEDVVIVTLKQDLQKSYLDSVFKDCSNRLVGADAHITGDGNSGHTEYSHEISVQRRLSYETRDTVGWVQLDAVALDESRLRVKLEVFECRRSHLKF